MTNTTTAVIELLSIERFTGTGKLIGLAVVRIELDGVGVTLQGVRVNRTSAGLTVEAPQFRHPRDGRRLPAVILPPELRDAIGREVLAGLNSA